MRRGARPALTADIFGKNNLFLEVQDHHLEPDRQGHERPQPEALEHTRLLTEIG
ncbi:MAG TPA: hypothetical protein VGZ73_23835 [Bryobacteraceae bacterium]|nr:hypothetical protein [Bryobacteraceae bacterium]